LNLAIFDLDNTLLAGDSDFLWGRFLVENQIVDGATYEQENLRFYREYQRGQLDIQEFLRFQLRPLTEHPPEHLYGLRERFLHEKIEPIILPAARQLIREHRSQGHTLMIITATNRFITEPVAERFGVRHLLATELEERAGRFTGRPLGTPSFREGKVQRLREWLSVHGRDLFGSWFYSDSHNDIPLLELVEHPVAVDPDEDLAQTARERAWPIISLRAGPKKPA
jgi:HAD superfamily hydrolase (TIGR01490 family)